jgi:thiol-disulfide isomerase/thioredoxin
MKTENKYPTATLGQSIDKARQRRKRMPKLISLAIVALVALAACSNAVAGDQPAANDQPAADDQPIAAEVALPADFQITAYQGGAALGGNEVKLSAVLAQGKPVVLNFWAGLCPPCRLEMPDLQAVHAEFGDRIVLFGLDVGPFTALGTSEEGQALIQELGVTYPTGTTIDAEVVRAYQITGMPSTFFIKPNGEIVRKWTGLLTEAKLAELVEELLEASSSS